MAGVGCRGTWGTRGARLSRVVLLQDVCSNTWLRSWASLLKDQSRYCPCAALVVQNSLFFFNYFFFLTLEIARCCRRGKTQPVCEPWSCCHAHPGLSRSSLLCSAPRLPRVSPATTPRRWLSCVTELQGQGHGDRAGLCKAERGLGKVSVCFVLLKTGGIQHGHPAGSLTRGTVTFRGRDSIKRLPPALAPQVLLLRFDGSQSSCCCALFMCLVWGCRVLAKSWGELKGKGASAQAQHVGFYRGRVRGLWGCPGL